MVDEGEGASAIFDVEFEFSFCGSVFADGGDTERACVLDEAFLFDTGLIEGEDPELKFEVCLSSGGVGLVAGEIILSIPFDGALTGILLWLFVGSEFDVGELAGLGKFIFLTSLLASGGELSGRDGNSGEIAGEDSKFSVATSEDSEEDPCDSGTNNRLLKATTTHLRVLNSLLPILHFQPHNPISNYKTTRQTITSFTAY